MHTIPDAKLLLVDDTVDNHLAIRAALDLDDRLVCVNSGKKALRHLLDDEFGLVLLDVNMPEMDGFEVATHIKSVERLRQIPIIFLSAARQEEAEVFKGYSVGAVDYLFTPVNPHLLRAKVNSLLLLHKLNAAVRRQADALLRINEALKNEIVDRQRAEADLLQAQKILEAQNIAVETATRMKSEFLANMSHELRTPLNGIIGFSEFILCEKAGDLNPKQREFLTDVLNSARHLLQLINDVLDLAKVEAGKMEISPKQFSVSKAIEEVCAVIKGIAHKKQINVESSVAPMLAEVTLDPQKFKQVLYNLLSNAVKFTDAGGCVQVAAAPRGQDHFQIAVKDSGIGIKPEDMNRLFREFQQLDTGSARRCEGTGLGLALTKKILEFQQGAIEVQSELGKGSTFTAVFPQVCSASPEI